MAEKLEMGMETLDRKLNGGLPKGSITVLEASPGSQGHLILHELTAARGTMWMSFARTEEAIEKTLTESPAPTGDVTVKYMSGETPIDDVGKFLAAVPPEDVDSALDALDAEGVAAAEVGVAERGSGVVLEGEELSLPVRDEMYELWD